MRDSVDILIRIQEDMVDETVARICLKLLDGIRRRMKDVDCIHLVHRTQ